MNEEEVVHIVLFGQPFCGFVPTIVNFPPGHKWVGPERRNDSTCSGCKTGLELYEAEKGKVE